MALPKKKKVPRKRYFYWNGEVHKVLRIVYPQNLVEAWNFPQRKSVALLYTDYRRDAGVALQTHDVADLFNVEVKVLKRALQRGDIARPQRTYALDGRFNARDYRWSEKDILDAHDALLSRHMGRPRRDGKITPNKNLPTRAELIAKLRGEQTLYIQTDDGRMVPVFEAQRW